jgi:hypothetical protein
MKVADNVYSFLGDGVDGDENVVYYVNGNDASKNLFLSNAILLNNAIVQETNLQVTGSAKNYESMLTDTESILGIVNDYVYKDFYVGTINNGSALKPFNISVHNQLALIEAYSWASFKLTRNILIPVSYEPQPLSGWYYGAGIDSNGNIIYSPNIQIEIKIIDIASMSLDDLPNIVYGQYPQGS